MAMLVCAAMLVTIVPMGTSAALPSEQTFISEDAEEATFDDWDDNWLRHDLDTTLPEDSDVWCRTMHRAHDSAHSIYCARNGWNSHYTLGGAQCRNDNITGSDDLTQQENVLRYDTRMDSVMRQTLDSKARYYGTITVTFWFWSDTGASDAKQPLTGAPVGYDFLNLVYWTGTGSNEEKHVAWTNTEAEATAKTWIQKSIEIPNTATSVGFEFVSGTVPPAGGDDENALSTYDILINGGMKEGVYLDDITVVGSDLLPAENLVTAVDPLPEYQNSLTFNVNWTNNDPQVGMKWIDLYYRVDGAGDWIKYETGLRPDGKFPNNTRTIEFTAPREGSYEFFTRGTDNAGVIEAARNAADATTVVDLTAPTTTIKLNGEGDGTNYRGTFSFSLSATDAISGVGSIHYRINGGSWKEYTGGVGLMQDGDYTIEYYATDKAGNDETVKRTTIHLEDAKPGITIETPVNSSNGNVRVNFTLVTEATVTSLQYILDGGEPVSMDVNDRTIELTGLKEGDHALTIKATDSEGDVMEKSISFSVGGGGAGSILSNPLFLVGIVAVVLVAIAGAFYIVRRKK
jgi:hypothetical protein